MGYWRLILVFSLICATDVVGAQDCGMNEKERIDNMSLHRFWVGTGNVGGILRLDDTNMIDGEERVYYDQTGRLRKITRWWEYSESSSAMIAYYNEEGKLMYILFSEFQPEGYSYQGIAHKTYHGEYCDSISFNYNMQYNWGINFENIHVQGYSDKYPQVTPEYNLLSRYTHADSLYYPSHLDLPLVVENKVVGNRNLVTFSRLAINQKSVINGTRVNIRESPSTSSEIVGTLDLGRRVKIIDIVQGTPIWYKVAVNDRVGYIFGAFLEPVEQVITE